MSTYKRMWMKSMNAIMYIEDEVDIGRWVTEHFEIEYELTYTRL